MNLCRASPAQKGWVKPRLVQAGIVGLAEPTCSQVKGEACRGFAEQSPPERMRWRLCSNLEKLF